MLDFLYVFILLFHFVIHLSSRFIIPQKISLLFSLIYNKLWMNKFIDKLLSKHYACPLLTKKLTSGFSDFEYLISFVIRSLLDFQVSIQYNPIILKTNATCLRWMWFWDSKYDWGVFRLLSKMYCRLAQSFRTFVYYRSLNTLLSTNIYFHFVLTLNIWFSCFELYPQI